MPQSEARWKRALRTVIDKPGMAQQLGVSDPRELCRRAWDGKDYVGDLDKALADLGTTEADGPKARKLVIDIIQWLAHEDRKAITAVAEADALIKASLYNEFGQGYGKSVGLLGRPSPNWPLYEKSGYVEVELDLVLRLRGYESIAKAMGETADMSATLYKLKTFLIGVVGGPDAVNLVVIAEPTGAGKSELVRQLREHWEAPDARGVPFALPWNQPTQSGFVYINFNNRVIGPTDAATALSDQMEKVLPGFPGGRSPRSAAKQLLEALDTVQSEGVPDEEDRKPNLIILDNLASVEPVDALLGAANAPGRPRHLVVLVTCRLALMKELGRHRIYLHRLSPINESDAKAILVRGLGPLGDDAESKIETIVDRLWLWPSLLNSAHEKLVGKLGSVEERAAEFVNYLESHTGALADAKADPHRFQAVISAFGQPPAPGPYIDDARRRKAALEREANRDGLPLGFDLNKQFVSLSITIPDQGQQPSVEGLRQAIEIVNNTRPESRLFVVTAPPGGGKSTLLRRAEWEQVAATLSTGAGAMDHSVPVLLYVALNTAPVDKTPRKWLHEDWWPEQHPEMPPLSQVLAERTVWLLLDAANELPTRGDVLDRMQVWVQSVDVLLPPDNSRHRAIFSCRPRDAGEIFGNEGAIEISIGAIDPDRLPLFLDHYLNPSVSREKAIAGLRQAWASEDPTGQVYGLPIWLKLICNHINEAGLDNLPRGRAGLVAGLVQRRLISEGRKVGGLLVRGRQQLVTENQWATIKQTRHFLESKGGTLLIGLEKLAYGMILAGDTSILVKRAHELIGPTGSAVLDCAHRALDVIRVKHKDPTIDTRTRLGVPVTDWEEDNTTRIEFIHQQFLEYFSGRHIARNGRIDSALVAPVWGSTVVLGEAVQFAAAILEDDDVLVRFLRDVMRSNLPLAARCVGQGDVRERLKAIDAELLATIRLGLQTRLTKDSNASRAERIDCAEALFWVEHPDYDEHLVYFEDRKLRFVVPREHARIKVRGGIHYSFGSDNSGNDDEKPKHQHRIDRDFCIAKFPLTNFEFACFVEARGYDDPRWWSDNLASEVRRAHGANEQIVAERLMWASSVKSWSREHYAEMVDRYPDWKVLWEYYRKLDLVAFRREQEDIWPPGMHDGWPRLWYDSAFNRLGQPVVAIDFYEARAYTRWLNAMCKAANLKVCVDLPSEDQWEAACGGEIGREWAGEAESFVASHYNTMEAESGETSVGRPTPVGTYPLGATLDGIHDLSGNVWEWTLTEYVSGRARDDRPGDENDPRSERAKVRVTKGGSWDNYQGYARAAYRSGDSIVLRDSVLGVRLVFNPS